MTEGLYLLISILVFIIGIIIILIICNSLWRKHCISVDNKIEEDREYNRRWNIIIAKGKLQNAIESEIKISLLEEMIKIGEDLDDEYHTNVYKGAIRNYMAYINLNLEEEKEKLKELEK